MSARNFITSLAENSVYLTLGVSSQSAIPTDDDHSALLFFQNIIGAKRIKKSNACLAVPRVNWSSGRFFPAYSSSDTNMASSSFYCMNTTYSVYKCLVSASSSTVQPTSTTPGIPVTLADNYKWLYLYTIPDSFINNFLTADFIPIPTVVTQPGVNDENYVQWLSQTSASAVNPTYPQGADAGLELFAKNVIVNGYFRFGEQSSGTADLISTTVSWFQVGMLLNPLDASTSSTTAVLPAYGINGLVVDPSKVLIMNNNSSSTQRGLTVIDNIKLVLSF